jgi:murein L,D-transpeptidase YcbB/YkuD
VLKQFCLLVALSSLASAATPDPTRKAVKRPSAHAVSTRAKAPTSAKVPTKKARKPAVKSKATRSARVARFYQQAPTPERYKEIQQALVGKGYLQGEPNGTWGPESTEALKRFQTEQNLTPDGKLSALSLVALGLGPKRLTAQSGPQQPPADGPK